MGEASKSLRDVSLATDPVDNTSVDGRTRLRDWLNRTVKVRLSDDRVLIGIFLCTDGDANIILGSCSEYASDSHKQIEDLASLEFTRMLGHAMVPGKYIKAVYVDAQQDRLRVRKIPSTAAIETTVSTAVTLNAAGGSATSVTTSTASIATATTTTTTLPTPIIVADRSEGV